jgi:hypothetical protein
MRAPLARYITLLLAVLFLWAGIYKLLYPGHATMALVSLGASRGIAKGLVAAIIAIELYLGSILLLKLDLKYALVLATCTIFTFTLYLFYLTTLTSPPSCGCLGLTGMFRNSREEAVWGVARNCAILWALSWLASRRFPVDKGDGSTGTASA